MNKNIRNHIIVLTANIIILISMVVNLICVLKINKTTRETIKHIDEYRHKKFNQHND